MSKVMNSEAIAPCGFNCALCHAYQKKENERGYCSGCNATDDKRQKHCVNCVMKKCSELTENGYKYCFECRNFPCRKLKLFNEKYVKRNNVSMIERLMFIRDNGINAFLLFELESWKCENCGSLICMDKKCCMNCGYTL